MRIPILQALNVKLVGRAVSPIFPPLVLSIDDVVGKPEVANFPNDFEYIAKVVVGFKQIGPKGAEPHIRQNAVRSIAHHLYGPVEQELRLAMEELWSMGVSNSSPVMLRLKRVIAGLRGEEN